MILQSLLLTLVWIAVCIRVEPPSMARDSLPNVVRSLLFNAAYVARQHNPELKMFFEKKLSEGKHYFSATCAVERKLVGIVYAVWKRKTPFVKCD